MPTRRWTVSSISSRKTVAKLLMDLSLNIQAFVSQRLIPTRLTASVVPPLRCCWGRRWWPTSSSRGEIDGVKEGTRKSENLGMKTFDTALFELYQQGLISEGGGAT